MVTIRTQRYLHSYYTIITSLYLIFSFKNGLMYMIPQVVFYLVPKSVDCALWRQLCSRMYICCPLYHKSGTDWSEARHGVHNHTFNWELWKGEWDYLIHSDTHARKNEVISQCVDRYSGMFCNIFLLPLSELGTIWFTNLRYKKLA